MIDAILGVIGTILYPLFSIIFLLIDLVQDIFRKFAGVETVYYAESGGIFNAGLKDVTSGDSGKDILADDNGGIVYYLLRSDLVMNLVWSIATLALILLIVFTVIAFIKNIYAPKSKSWQEIIGLSVKGLFNFIFIPVVCLLGIILGNILLNAIDGATSSGGATVMSRKLFLSAAADANIIRSDQKVTYKRANEAAELYQEVFGTLPEGIRIIPESEMPRRINIFGKETDDPDKNATLSEEYGHVDGTREDVINLYASMIDEAFANGSGVKTSIYEVVRVGKYYNAWGINYLTLAVGGIFMLYALGAISFGMIKRLFTLIMLFIISPAACAMYPLDEGNACKQITGEFKKNTISAYGAVAGMNIFFSIAPLVQNINLSNATVFQSIVHLILLTCGLFMVKDLISMISNYFGAGNAYADGSSMMKQVKDKVGGGAKKLTVGAFKAHAHYKGAREAGATRGEAWSDFFKTQANTLHTKVTGVDIIKTREEIKKEKKDTKENFYKEANENHKREESRTALRTNGGSSSDYTMNDGSGGTFNITAGDSKHIQERLRALVPTGQLSNSQIDDLLASATTNRARKALAEEIATFQNSRAARTRRFGTTTDIETFTQEKVLEKSKERGNARQAITNLSAEREGFERTAAERERAFNEFHNYEASHGGEPHLNSITRLDAGQIEQLKIDSQQKDSSGAYTPAALTAQRDLREQVMLKEYDKLRETANDMDKTLRESAKNFASQVKSAAELQSEGNKATLTQLSDEIKNLANAANALNRPATTGGGRLASSSTEIAELILQALDPGGRISGIH